MNTGLLRSYTGLTQEEQGHWVGASTGQKRASRE